MPARTAPRKTQAKKDTAATPAAEHENRYAPRVWGSNGIGTIEDLTCPSGQVCQARRPGIEGLIREGILRNMDALTALVETEHVDRVKKPGRAEKAPDKEAEAKALQEQLFNNPAKFDEMMHVVDRVVTNVVIQPTILMTPNDPSSRESGAVYADMVELDDKMFIFNYAVGGTRDLEQFRKERLAALGGVEPLEAVGGTAE